MSAENVELVRKALEAFRERREDAVPELVHPDFEMIQMPQHPEAAGEFRGWDAADNSMLSWNETFEDFQWSVEELLDAGDRVVAITHTRARGRGSAVDMDHEYGMVFTIRDAKIAAM
jgi:ketosteroid isomerase-like protein